MPDDFANLIPTPADLAAGEPDAAEREEWLRTTLTAVAEQLQKEVKPLTAGKSVEFSYATGTKNVRQIALWRKYHEKVVKILNQRGYEVKVVPAVKGRHIESQEFILEIRV